MDSLAVLKLLGVPDSVDAEEDFRAPGEKLISWTYSDVIVLLGSNNYLGGIWITGPGAATARGLRIGDSDARVRELYGEPSDTYGSEWQYEDRSGVGDVVRISVVDGRVTRIYLGHLYD